MGYDYLKLCNDIKDLTNKYKSLDVFHIGKSVMGRSIYCIRVGMGKRKIFIGGAYHGLEYLTSLFLIRFIDEYMFRIINKWWFAGFNTEDIFKDVTMFIVPMVNPDGVDIATNGLDLLNIHHRNLIDTVGIHDFRHVWQANARGVDLNHNYDANWKMTVPSPSPTKYGGENPESECETQAIVNFIRKTDFDMLLAFHSQGKEIYYSFDGTNEKKAFLAAQKLADISGYTLIRPTGSDSYGGCKDWFIMEFGKLGFTIEIGKGKNPLPISMIDDVFLDNARIILCASEIIS